MIIGKKGICILSKEISSRTIITVETLPAATAIVAESKEDKIFSPDDEDGKRRAIGSNVSRIQSVAVGFPVMSVRRGVPRLHSNEQRAWTNAWSGAEGRHGHANATWSE